MMMMMWAIMEEKKKECVLRRIFVEPQSSIFCNNFELCWLILQCYFCL